MHPLEVCVTAFRWGSANLDTIRRRVLHGFGWRSLTDALNIVLQLVFTAILARLLGISDFGLIAACFLFIRFVSALADVGFGSAIMQSQTITERQISALFFIQIAIKASVFAICFLLAPFAATFFKEAGLTELI